MQHFHRITSYISMNSLQRAKIWLAGLVYCWEMQILIALYVFKVVILFELLSGPRSNNFFPRIFFTDFYCELTSYVWRHLPVLASASRFFYNSATLKSYSNKNHTMHRADRSRLPKTPTCKMVGFNLSRHCAAFTDIMFFFRKRISIHCWRHHVLPSKCFDADDIWWHSSDLLWARVDDFSQH